MERASGSLSGRPPASPQGCQPFLPLQPRFAAAKQLSSLRLREGVKLAVETTLAWVTPAPGAGSCAAVEHVRLPFAPHQAQI